MKRKLNLVKESTKLQEIHTGTKSCHLICDKLSTEKRKEVVHKATLEQENGTQSMKEQSYKRFQIMSPNLQKEKVSL